MCILGSFLVASSLAIGGCQDEAPTASALDGDLQDARLFRRWTVSIQPESLVLSLGDTGDLQAVVRDRYQRIRDVAVTWTSADPKVAAVGKEGDVVAVAPGEVTVTAAYGGANDAVRVLVADDTATEPAPDPEPDPEPDPDPAPVASVTVSPSSGAAQVGQSVTFRADLRDANGNALEGRPVTWSSSNPSVATIDSNGVATGVGAGSTVVRATSEGREGQATLTVTAPPTGGSPAVFTSEWSTELGNSRNAVTDGGRWPVLACGNTFPTVLTVVGASALGFNETPNVLRMQQRGPNACGMLQVNDVVPASTTHWGRFYVRNDENGNSGDHPTGYNNAHWNGGAIQAVPWARESSSHVTPGTWRTSVGGGASYPFNKWWGPVLQNGQWYRFEWEMRYVSATRYQVWPRLYDAAGNLIADADDFRQQDYQSGGFTLASYYASGRDFSLADPLLARHFGMGHEGTSGDATMGYWYYGKFAMSTQGWLGR